MWRCDVGDRMEGSSSGVFDKFLERCTVVVLLLAIYAGPSFRCTSVVTLSGSILHEVIRSKHTCLTRTMQSTREAITLDISADTYKRQDTDIQVF